MKYNKDNQLIEFAIWAFTEHPFITMWVILAIGGLR
jgi:hypothetical protein